jgi:hypothetical protein
MHKFHFRPGKSAFMALLTAGAAILAGWRWFEAGDLFWLALALLCAAGAAKMLSDVLSDTPALAFDAEGLRVRSTWGSVHSVSWREVQAIKVDVMTLRYFGIIPIARHETLVVKCDGGLFGSRRLRLALKLVQLPPGGAGHLLALLDAAHVAAVGQAGVAMAGAGEHGWGLRSVSSPVSAASRLPGDEGSGFDADAALARYLARKERAEPVAPAPSASAPVPLQPSRPVFGRKPLAG